VPWTVKYVFNFRQKVSKNKSSRSIRVGRLFQRCGPAAANAPSPRCELVLVHLKLSDDRSWWHPMVSTSWQSSDRYGGARCHTGLDVVAVCIVAGVYAVISLNGRYPQVTLVDSSLASGSSSHTTVVVHDGLDQSLVTSLSHQPSM